MAANPTFLSQYKTKITSDSSLVFQPTKNSRIYNTYCRNSSGIGTTKIEVGTPAVGAPSVLNANVDVNLRYEFFNTGLDVVQNGSQWYETIKVGGTINYGTIEIELEGTFPLVNETTFQYFLDLPGSPVEQRSKIFAPATAAQDIADAIVSDIIVRREMGFFNGTSYTATTLDLPRVQYLYPARISEPNGTQLVAELPIQVNKLKSTRLGALPTFFTKSNTGLLFSYEYKTETVDGKEVPSNLGANFVVQPSIEAETGQPAGVRFFPTPNNNSLSGFEVWDIQTTAGTESDPYLLRPDLKSKLLNLFQNGSVLVAGTRQSGSDASQQSFTLNANSFVVSEVVASLPILVESDFTASGESIELIDDETINPLLITDAHGNKFFPVQAGQRIVISAPEAESIILVYGEE